VRLLERLGITDRVDHVVVLALDGGSVLGEHFLDDLARLVERRSIGALGSTSKPGRPLLCCIAKLFVCLGVNLRFFRFR
jgi:hypothetical protein